MKIEDLQAHCVEQMRKLPRGSKMYEEHLLTLSIIDTNKKYFNEIDKLNKMKQHYKIALFMIIRNSQVMPKGIELGKSDKEINKMAYETMCEVLTMIDFKRAREIYEHGKKAYEED